MSESTDRALRSKALFVRFLVILLSPPRQTVLELESIEYSNSNHRSASSRERHRSTIGIAAVQTAIEYEYEYEHEHEDIRSNARSRTYPGDLRDYIY